MRLYLSLEKWWQLGRNGISVGWDSSWSLELFKSMARVIESFRATESTCPFTQNPHFSTLALGFKLLMQSALWCSLGLGDCACAVCWPLLFIPSCILPAPTFECCVRDCQTSLDTKTYTHPFFLHYLLFISFLSIIYLFLHTESTYLL